MQDEATIKARIQILTSLSTLTVSINGKIMDESGMDLGSLTEQNVEIHFLRLLEEVAALAAREEQDGWQFGLVMVRATAVLASGDDPDQAVAYQRFVTMTNSLIA